MSNIFVPLSVPWLRFRTEWRSWMEKWLICYWGYDGKGVTERATMEATMKLNRRARLL